MEFQYHAEPPMSRRKLTPIGQNAFISGHADVPDAADVRKFNLSDQALRRSAPRPRHWMSDCVILFLQLGWACVELNIGQLLLRCATHLWSRRLELHPQNAVLSGFVVRFRSRALLGASFETQFDRAIELNPVKALIRCELLGLEGCETFALCYSEDAVADISTTIESHCYRHFHADV